MSQQGYRQSSVRAVTNTTLSYDGDWTALFDGASIPAGDFDGRLLQWLNAQIGVTYTNLPEAMHAFAVSQGAFNWSSMGTFNAGSPAAPVNTVLPVISGIKTRGQTLSTTNGTWTGSPTGYTYQWQRDGSDIGSATSATYLLAAGDVGKVITVVVTATNATGSTPATSAGTSAIAALLSISGTPVTTATQNSAYTGFSVSGAGGHTAYVYSVHAGALPTGITLNSSTGAVAGTPTVVENQTGIVIRVTDADGLTADLASFGIDVSAAVTAVTWDGAASVRGTLSNGNLTGTATSDDGKFIATKAVTSGQIGYLEFYANSVLTDMFLVGTAKSSWPASSDFLGAGPQVGLQAHTKAIYINLSVADYMEDAYDTGDYIGLKIDYSANQATYYFAAANRTVTLPQDGSPMFPAAEASNGAVVTLNAGATSWFYSLPAGATALKDL